MNKLSLLIRKITIPPVFATALLILVYAFHPAYFGNIRQMLLGIFFLAILPVLAYPLQKYIPKFKDKGRDGQRTLAMIFSFFGYLIGTVTAFVCSVPIELIVIYLEYLLCGILILIFNKVFKLKVSGHACGIVGPVLLLGYFKLYIAAVIGALLIVPVYISSIRSKRHSPWQLVGGSLIPLFVILEIGITVFICF